MRKFLACSMILTLLTSMGSVCFANPITLDLKGHSTLDEVFDVEQFDFAVRYRLSQTFYNKAVEFYKLVDEERYEEAAKVIDASLIGKEAIDLIMSSEFGREDYRRSFFVGFEPIESLAYEAKMAAIKRKDVSSCANNFLYNAKDLKEEYSVAYECYKKSIGHNATVYKTFVEEAIQLGEKFQQISDFCSVDAADFEKGLKLSSELVNGATELHNMCSAAGINNGDMLPTVRQFSGVEVSGELLMACLELDEALKFACKIDPDFLRMSFNNLEYVFQCLSSECQEYIDSFVEPKLGARSV